MSLASAPVPPEPAVQRVPSAPSPALVAAPAPPPNWPADVPSTSFSIQREENEEHVPNAVPRGATPEQPDKNAEFDELYERLLWRLSAELRSDRERSGHLSDIW
jgi:hypothetical protein